MYLVDKQHVAVVEVGQNCGKVAAPLDSGCARKFELSAHFGGDYVRLSYYDSSRAISELHAQRRNEYYGLDALYKPYYESGQWSYDPEEVRYNTDTEAPNVTIDSFTLPFPTEDVVFNPHLLEAAQDVDVRSTFSY